MSRPASDRRNLRVRPRCPTFVQNGSDRLYFGGSSRCHDPKRGAVIGGTEARTSPGSPPLLPPFETGSEGCQLHSKNRRRRALPERRGSGSRSASARWFRNHSVSSSWFLNTSSWSVSITYREMELRSAV